MHIDEKDQRILEILQHDGRISNRALAKQIGLSNSACLERVRRLERIGAIVGYHARLAPVFASRPFEVWANVSLLDLPNATQDAFLFVVHESPHVMRVVQLTGAFDCLVHFVANDAKLWRAFCSEICGLGIARERISFGVVANAHAMSRQ